ncbi:phosphomannomutase/phosphoglucomutase [Pelagibaculum spongiae]|nr:phosphomannomutase/phosphoglucomutase [Pelagibaculum spongiae]
MKVFGRNLFTRKETSKVPDNKEPRIERSMRFSSMLWRGAGLVALSLMVVLAWHGWSALVVPAETKQFEKAQQQSTVLASALAGRLQLWQSQLDQSAANPYLAVLLQGKDPSSIARMESELSARQPWSIDARLLPTNLIDPDLEAGLTYSVLEMLRHAERGEMTVEAINWKDRQARINMASPIRDAKDRVNGVLLASYDKRFVKSITKGLESEGFFVELHQQFNQGSSQLLARFGAPSLRSGSQLASANIQGTSWQLRVWAGQPSENWMEMIQLWPFSVVFLTMWLGVLLVSRRQQKLLNEDAHLLIEVVQRYDTKRLGNFALPQFKDVAEVLIGPRASHSKDPLVPMKTAAVASKPSTTEALQPNTGVEVTELGSGSNNGLDKGLINFDSKPEPKVEPISNEIFFDSEIRGVVDQQITDELAFSLGRAIASEAWERGERSIVVGRDGRNSGVQLIQHLIRGLVDSGMDVVDLDQVPTPVVYFGMEHLKIASSVVVTGSHHAFNENGFRVILAGEPLLGDGLTSLKTRIEQNNFNQGKGSFRQESLEADYMDRILSDVVVARPIKVAVDCGNGVAGTLLPELLRQLGCEVEPLYCDVDGNFPNHQPDPANADNLKDLIAHVKKHDCELGIALDGDGDRLGVVSSDGSVVWGDQLLMLFAEDMLERNPGADVVFDVACSKFLRQCILRNGGRPLMNRCGHLHIQSRMKESGALLAGELSGHIFFKERWYGFDDGLYAAARLLEVIAQKPGSADQIFSRLPHGVVSPKITMTASDNGKHQLVQKLAAEGNFPDGEKITLDGLRVEFEQGWGMVRASAISPALVMRFEADTEQELQKIQNLFKGEISRLEPNIMPSF